MPGASCETLYDIYVYGNVGIARRLGSVNIHTESRMVSLNARQTIKFYLGYFKAKKES